MTDDFLWGAAISPHQVEGYTDNDWDDWEQRHAEDLADRAHDRFGDLDAWDRIAEQAQDPANYVSGDAIRHYDRYGDDIELADDLGLNALRVGIEWSRVEPEPGEYDEDAIQHYHDYIDTLHDHGIEPIVTLWHFTNPDWLVEQGGWHDDQAVEAFDAYVDRMVDEFGDDVDYWVTLNEPSAWVRSAYGVGTFLPQGTTWPGAELDEKRVPFRPRKLWQGYTNLAEAHQEAYDTIKEHDEDAMVGTANSMGAWRPHNDNPVNRALTSLIETLEYDDWLQRNEDHFDFIGINHYVPIDVDVFLRGNDYETSDMGWFVDTESLGEVIETISDDYDLPIMVTEHGLADAGDDLRQELVEDTVPLLEELAEEHDLLGYMHWSLLDNFEWDKGFWPRFGLVDVDRETLEREPRTSAELYRDLIADSEL